MRSHTPGLRRPPYKYQRSPAREEQLAQRPGHFPHRRDTRINSPTHAKAPGAAPCSQRQPEGGSGPNPARGGCGASAPAGMAAPAKEGLSDGGSSAALPTAPRRLRGRAPLSAASAALGFIFPRSHIVLCSAGTPIGTAAPRPPSRLRQAAAAASLTNGPRGRAPPAEGRAEGRAGTAGRPGGRSSAASAREAG